MNPNTSPMSSALQSGRKAMADLVTFHLIGESYPGELMAAIPRIQSIFEASLREAAKLSRNHPFQREAAIFGRMSTLIRLTLDDIDTGVPIESSVAASELDEFVSAIASSSAFVN